MTSTFKKNIFDFFIHKDIDPKRRRNAEYIVTTTVVTLSSSSLSTCLYYSLGMYQLAFMGCLTFFGIFLALASLRYLGNVEISVYSVVVFAIASVIGSCLTFGGMLNANIYWLMVMPLGVALVLEFKHSLWTCLLCCLATLTVYFLDPEGFDSFEMKHFDLFSTAALFVVNAVIFVGVGFALIFRQQMQAMYSKLADRNQSIENLVNNVQTGFLMVDRNMRIKPGFSKACLHIFHREELIGLDFPSLISEDSRQIIEYKCALAQIFDDSLPEQVMLGNLPAVISPKPKDFYSLEGKIIRDQSSQISSVLFTIKDVSNLIKVQKENQRNLVLLQNVRNREGLLSMLRETYEGLTKLEQNFLGSKNVYSQRILHTLKGSLASFGLDAASHLIHKLEDKPSIDHGDINQLTDLINQFLKDNEEVLGIQSLALVQNQSFSVQIEQISKLKQLARQSLKHQDLAFQKMSQAIEQLASISVKHLLLPLEYQLEQIAIKLGKPVSLKFIGPDVYAGVHLTKVLQHFPNLLRNALYHGLEEEHERMSKPWPPEIAISLEDNGDWLRLAIADDGRGINPMEIKQRALELKILPSEQLASLSEQQLIDLVFEDGMSTERNPNEISGRGSGMAAFKAEITSFGGTVHLNSQVGQGTQIIIELPKYILEPVVSAAS